MATMQTMTSAEAQNQFGRTLDRSQRQPVIITRRGRPTSMMISVSGDGIPFTLAKALSELYPMRGEDAGRAVKELLEHMSQQQGAKNAIADGITEEDIMQIVHENRI